MFGVVWLSDRLKAADEEGVPTAVFTPSFLTYLPWLAWQIALSNWAVVKVILSPSQVDPQLVIVDPTQQSWAGRALHANSITLTPGTVSVRMYDEDIIVHALTPEFGADVLEGAIDDRVTALERAP